jgi:hypothetical protein
LRICLIDKGGTDRSALQKNPAYAAFFWGWTGGMSCASIHPHRQAAGIITQLEPDVIVSGEMLRELAKAYQAHN